MPLFERKRKQHVEDNSSSDDDKNILDETVHAVSSQHIIATGESITSVSDSETE
eukprot:Pgem_evm1s11908